MNTLLTTRERERYSLFRALENANVRNANVKSCLETEVTQTLRKKMTEDLGLGLAPQGCLIPFECLERRTMSASTFAQGGATVSDLRGPIDPFPFSQAVLRKAGANDLTGLTGNLGLPVLSSSNEATWLAENAAADQTKDSSFALMGATPRRLVSTRKISKQLRAQMSQSSEDFMRETLTAPTAAAIDRAGLAGPNVSGGGVAPTGLLNISGVTIVSLGGNGGAIGLTNLNALEAGVMGYNFALESAAYVMSPNTRTCLKKTAKGTGTSTYLLETQNSQDFCNGFRSWPTASMPDTLSKGTANSSLGSAIYGDFSRVNICTWGALDIVIDPFTYAAAGIELWSITVFADIVATRPAAFAAFVDVVTT
jgi:HK97 family phage major capsid protein